MNKLTIPTRLICFLALLCVSLTLWGKDDDLDPYWTKTSQTAIKTAFKILTEVYYSADELCVSDSIYSLDWTCFQKIVNNKTGRSLVSAFDYFTYTKPYYSEIISQLFGSTPSANCKYVALFSEPHNYLNKSFRCDIIPIDKTVGHILKPKIGSMFLFLYNDNGEIYQVSKIEADKAESIVDY